MHVHLLLLVSIVDFFFLLPFLQMIRTLQMRIQHNANFISTSFFFKLKPTQVFPAIGPLSSLSPTISQTFLFVWLFSLLCLNDSNIIPVCQYKKSLINVTLGLNSLLSLNPFHFNVLGKHYSLYGNVCI